jgi:hypothetical protein
MIVVRRHAVLLPVKAMFTVDLHHQQNRSVFVAAWIGRDIESEGSP